MMVRAGWMMGIVLSLLAAAPVPAAPQEQAAGRAASRWGDPRADKWIKQGLAAARAGNVARAALFSERLQRAYPTEPARLVIDFTVAAKGYSPLAATLFARMAAERARVLAAPLPLLDPAEVRRVIYIAVGAEQVRLARAIVDSGWSSGPGSGEQARARHVLIADAIGANDIARAVRLLDGLDDPGVLADFLIFDEFAPVQPAIVARWGADLAGLDRHRGELLAAQSGGANPSPRLVAQRADWLIQHDRAAEAVAIVRPALASGSATDPLVRESLVMTGATAAAHTGAGDEALAMLDTAARSKNIDTEEREILQTAHAIMAGDLGRPAEAMAIARSILVNDKSHGDWTKASARRIVACAAADMGQPAVAQRELAALLALGDVDLFKVQALLCLDEPDRAAAIVVVALRHRTGSDIVRLLQVRPSTCWGQWQRRWQAAFAALRDRPDVRRALIGYGSVRPLACPATNL